ncbi:PDCD1 protein, partial [Pachyramphus minor]|nr:PDCD1 protein [Pachyramphus minor]
MWGSMEVALAGLCTVLLCCGPLLVCCRQVTIFPSVLTFHEGGIATFSCNISMQSDSGSEYSLNWYKETDQNQAQKIAEISQNNPIMETEKYRLTNHTPVFKIEILNLHQNDSGYYYCGLITLFEPNKVMESKRSQLMVTAAPEMNPTEEPEIEEGDPSDHIKVMLLGILLLAVVILLLIFGYLTITYRRGGMIPLRPCKPNLGAGISQMSADAWGKPPVVSVSTVDYGVLEFQRDQCIHVLPETQPVDQTEYATIIFPEEKPVTPERGKKRQD